MTPDFSAKVRYLWDTIGDRRIIAIVGHAGDAETVRGWMRGEPCEQQERVEILYDFTRRILDARQGGPTTLRTFLTAPVFSRLAYPIAKSGECAATFIRDRSPHKARRACEKAAKAFEEYGWANPAFDMGGA